MAEIKAFTIERPWGSFRQFTQNISCTVKIHTVQPGEESSLQTHAKRSEFLRVLSGGGILRIGEIEYKVVEGDEYNIPVGAKHRWIAGSAGMVALEISTGDFDEKDIIRYEDKYGRV